MVFWIICALVVLVVAAFVAAPLLRAQETPKAAPDVALYKAQLSEIDRDVARAVIDPSEAERARAEVSRRLIAASARRTQRQDAPAATNRIMAAATVFGLLALAGLTYWQIGAPDEPDQPIGERYALAEDLRNNRPSQSALEAATPAEPAGDWPAEYLASVAQLRTVVPTRPVDLEGWTLLAYHETQLRQFGAAAVAQARVVALKGADATVDDQVRLADLMVFAAGGFVSPEAETVVRNILTADENNIPARFYLGALYAQTARPDIAFRLWRPLMDVTPETYHTALARAQIADVAAGAGVDYAPPQAPGPDAAAVANAQSMSPQDRQAMITGMVAQLADRLATEGGPASDWARLITAYGVLGDAENAQTIWTEAQDVFGADPAAMVILRAAATQAGLP